MIRYKRHIALNEVGVKGQSKINNSSVLVVGSGGLGSPAIEYLSRAGVGVIGIIDFDNVELSNLHRQILFSEDDLNKNKAICAQEYIKRINSSIKINTYSEALTIKNGSRLIQQYDIIVDGTDDVKIRYLLNDFCVLLDKPLVYAALYKFEGQISVFNYKKGPTYRCLFPVIPKDNELPNCSQTGILGVVPGLLGIYQANEVLKIILDIGEVLTGKVLNINLLRNTHTTFRFSKNVMEVDKLIKKGVPYSDSISFINSDYTISLNSLKKNDNCIFIDVRNEDEEPIIKHKKIHHIPLGKLKDEFLNIVKDKKIIFFCSSGKRSIKAAVFTNKNSSLIYWKKNMTLFTGVATISYKDGILSSSRTYKNGKKNGLWREWYENGQLKWTGTYKDEKEIGLWRGWYENGQLESEGNYKDGEWDELWRGWYENGNKRGEWNWKDGKWDGLQRHWHENGQLWFEINSKNGEEISKKCWDENGNEKECK